MRAELIGEVETGSTLGEGVVYCSKTDTVWWTDIQESRLYKLDWESRALTTYDTPERLCSFGLTADPGNLIAAFESGFAFFEPETNTVDWISKPFNGTPGMRFNDGRVDRHGRFWVGTMAEDNKAETIKKSKLYCLHPDLTVSEHLQDFHISNAICWSPDGGVMYFADSSAKTIWSFDVNPETGDIDNRRIFVTLSDQAGPDGAVTDEEGYLWNAQWGGSRVVRYSPSGNQDFTLTLPVSQPSCTGFGGPGGNILFVTTARENLTEEQISAEPKAGNLFIYQTNVKAAPTPIFGG